MDQIKRATAILAVFAMIAGIVTCIFAVPTFILATRQLMDGQTTERFAVASPSPVIFLPTSVVPPSPGVPRSQPQSRVPATAIAPMPVPAATATLVSTLPSGGNVWREGNIRIEAGLQSPDGPIMIWFRITNEGSTDFIARFKWEDFSAVDDTGKTYLVGTSGGPMTRLIPSNESVTYHIVFLAPPYPNAKTLTLRLASLSGSPPIAVQIPLVP